MRNPATMGINLDILVSLAFYELKSHPTFIMNNDATTDIIFKEEVKGIIRLNKNTDGDLVELLMLSKHFILPKHYCGPDGMLFINDILYLVGIKSTIQVGRAVDIREVQANYNITDLQNLRLNAIEKVRLLNDICNIFKPKAIIRLHIVLPRAPSTTSTTLGDSFVCDYQVISIKDKEENIDQQFELRCPQISVNLDSSNFILMCIE